MIPLHAGFTALFIGLFAQFSSIEFVTGTYLYIAAKSFLLHSIAVFSVKQKHFDPESEHYTKIPFSVFLIGGTLVASFFFTLIEVVLN